MTLAALLVEIEASQGSIVPAALASRLGLSPGELEAMLDALRANGLLQPEIASATPSDCSPAGLSCAKTCPGPANCALVVDLGVHGLEIRGTAGKRSRTPLAS